MTMKRVLARLSRFRREEDGNSTIEFAIYFTTFFIILAVGVEIAIMNLRHSMLERGVDLVTRDIRLATGDIPSYAAVREKICEESKVLGDCEGNLRLEMQQVEPRAFAVSAEGTDCQNAEEEPRPVRMFQPGTDNQLMLIRACLKYKPMIPGVGLAKELNLDSEGYAQMIVTSAFVQEPR